MNSSPSGIKTTTLYAERDEEKRRAFDVDFAKLNPGQILYMDESGIDESLQKYL